MDRKSVTELDPQIMDSPTYFIAVICLWKSAWGRNWFAGVYFTWSRHLNPRKDECNFLCTPFEELWMLVWLFGSFLPWANWTELKVNVTLRTTALNLTSVLLIQFHNSTLATILRHRFPPIFCRQMRLCWADITAPTSPLMCMLELWSSIRCHANAIDTSNQGMPMEPFVCAKTLFPI